MRQKKIGIKMPFIFSSKKEINALETAAIWASQVS